MRRRVRIRERVDAMGVLVDLTMLLAVAAASPAQIWSRNLVGVGHMERLAGLALTTWGLGVATYMIGLIAGVRRNTILVASFLATVLFARGGS